MIYYKQAVDIYTVAECYGIVTPARVPAAKI